MAEVLTLFPFAGIQYVLNLDATIDGIKKADMTTEAKNELNEFYISGGLGADFALSDAFYLRGMFDLGYNLLAKNSAAQENARLLGWGYTFGGMKIGGSVGVGYRF